MEPDYTVSHTCGHETYYRTLREAKGDAKEHLKKCRRTETAMIDYHDGYERTGKYWEIQK
jgi:hypothetical protein